MGFMQLLPSWLCSCCWFCSPLWIRLVGSGLLLSNFGNALLDMLEFDVLVVAQAPLAARDVFQSSTATDGSATLPRF